MGARGRIWLQQVTEDGVRDEVEHVPGDVPQDHGSAPPVEALEALGLQDAADAVDRAAVERRPGGGDGAQVEVGTVRNELQVFCQNKTKKVQKPGT